MINFSEIPGQSTLKEKLVNSVLNNRIPHAQMFISQDGGAGIPIAIALTRYILCNNRNETDSCGECEQCKQFDRLQYPNLHYSFPFVKSKLKNPVCNELHNVFAENVDQNPFLTKQNWTHALEIENQQTIIPVTESESILQTLSIKSFGGKPRIIIIWLPELLHKSAANKLLKIIEEPQPNTYFMFVTNHIERVLETIKSRCVIHKTEINTRDEIAHFLELNNVSSTSLNEILLNTNGSIGQTLAAIKDEAAYQAMSELFVEWVRVVFKGNAQLIVELSEKIASLKREEIKIFIKFSSEIFAQSLRVNSDTIGLGSFKTADFDVKRFAPFIKSERIDKILWLMEEARADISRNSYAKSTILDTSLQLTKYIGQA